MLCRQSIAITCRWLCLVSWSSTPHVLFFADMHGQAAAKAAEASLEEEQWITLLGHRQRLRASADEDEEENIYKKRVAEDRARVRRKFFPNRDKTVRHTGRSWSHPWGEDIAAAVRDVAPNDTGLPRSETSPMATMLEDWCKQGSWGICRQCFSLTPRHLKEVDTRRVAGPSVASCRWCTKDGNSSVPQVKDVPKRLRGLTPAMLAALSLFDMDCGPYQRPPHGYRVHTAMLRLLWSKTSVEEKIADLPRRASKRASAAHACLMHCKESEYKSFYKQHARFLRANPDPSEADRRRPLQQLEAQRSM